MEVFVIFLLLNVINLSICGEFYTDFFRNNKKSDNLTIFPKLVNKQTNATYLKDGTYEWLAKIVLSREGNIPFICNAICIAERIFITASRCVLNISLYYTRVIYKKERLKIIAEVSPQYHTVQFFDDISFLVTSKLGLHEKWKTIDIFDGPNRTDDKYEWFLGMNITGNTKNHKIISYASSARNQFSQTENSTFALYELKVTIGMKSCQRIYAKRIMTGYNFPCAHQCLYTEFENKSPVCQRYLGVEGAAIYNYKTRKLLGISTWGEYESEEPTIYLPVGFAIPNSINFYKNYECAQLIRQEDMGDYVQMGFYDELCKSIQ